MLVPSRYAQISRMGPCVDYIHHLSGLRGFLGRSVYPRQHSAPARRKIGSSDRSHSIFELERAAAFQIVTMAHAPDIRARNPVASRYFG